MSELKARGKMMNRKSKGRDKREVKAKTKNKSVDRKGKHKPEQGGEEEEEQEQEEKKTCIYVPRLCADPYCGALAVEVAVVKSCAAASSSSSSYSRRRDKNSSRAHHGDVRVHGRACHDALASTLQRKDELERPAERVREFPHLGSPASNRGSFVSSAASRPRRGQRGKMMTTMTMMTPSFSTQLINAESTRPLTSFSSPLFPCAPVGTKKWEQHLVCATGATRFGDRDGRLARGFGGVWWDFEPRLATLGVDDDENEDENEDDKTDDDDDDDDADEGEWVGSDVHEDDNCDTTKHRGRKGRARGEYLRRSTPANSCGPEGLLYCAGHLCKQYPSLSEKELQRIKEFWASLESSGRHLNGGGDIMRGRKGLGLNCQTSTHEQKRAARGWARRMEVKHPDYWQILIQKGLAL